MRRSGAAWGMSLVLFLLLSASATAAAADQESYYLGPEGIPNGDLLLNPRGGELPNYDRGRDVEPGLILERSALGIAETEDTRYQHWQIEAGGSRLKGFPTVIIWSAAAQFEAGKRGVFEIFLLDCNGGASDCEEIDSSWVEVDSTRGATWIESTVDFPEVDHRFDRGRHLGLRVVVSDASESDWIFAYGNTAHRSRLTIFAERPIRPVETTIPVDTKPEPASEAAPVLPAAVEVEEVPIEAAQDPTGSLMPWLVTLVLCTAALVVFGAALMASLTRPGRHERLVGEHATHQATVGSGSLRRS